MQQRKPIRETAGFSTETLKPGRAWHQAQKESYNWPRLLYPAKLSS
jgi:hypothetical protein